jgi:hypothetical protein
VQHDGDGWRCLVAYLLGRDSSTPFQTNLPLEIHLAAPNERTVRTFT